jgi:N-methylhydantoinase A/oxoprolinase/acetone carboxylase beta subunit
LAWLGRDGRDLDPAFDYLAANRRRLAGNSEAAQMFTLNHRRLDTARGDLEERVLDLLSRRPYSLLELAEATRVPHVGLLPLPRLESLFAVQRCGLTPTDLLHATGRFVRWNAAASTRMVGLAAGLAGTTPATLLTDLLRRVVRQLTMDVIHHQLAPATPHTSRETCPTCERIFENLLDGGGRAFAVRFELRRPIIGVGAPIGHFLPEVAQLLGARAVVPDFHDVANAVGAIVSEVSIKRQVAIKPDPAGGFYIEGLSGHQRFQALDAANGYVQRVLTEEVRRLAAQAGTRENTVQLTFKDVTAKTGRGEEVFIERQVVSEIQGIPDLM